MKKFSLKSVWPLLKKSFKGFSEDKVPKLSASLAYYTVFSLGPLLIVIISICGFFFGQEAIQGTVYTQMEGFIGHDGASQLQELIKNAAISDKGTIATIIGAVTLLIGATTVFGEIQDSINTIWGLKSKPKAGLMKLIKDRLLSFGLIGSLGFLLLVSLGVTALISGLNDRLKDIFPDVTVVLFYIINIVLTLAITTILFAVIFKVLPDAKIKWGDVWIGAFATSLLFLIGKFGISFYISKSDVGSTFGAAGSLVVLLVWVYYSAIILYFGAEFTKAYVVEYGSDIHPNEYAVEIEKVEVEKGSATADEGTQKKQLSSNVSTNSGIQQKSATESKQPLPTAVVPHYTKAPTKPLHKKPTPQSGTHVGGFAAVALGIVAFVIHTVKTNRSA